MRIDNVSSYRLNFLRRKMKINCPYAVYNEQSFEIRNRAYCNKLLNICLTFRDFPELNRRCEFSFTHCIFERA